ncbi:unnamed protein product [Urochloa humidicola]
METIIELLLTVGLAALVFLPIFRRRSTGSPRTSPAIPTIEVNEPTLARRMLVEHADTFSNRPVSPFPVEFVTGDRVNLSHSISTVPHGPLWHALRCNLTAGIFHPSRLGLLAPLQRDAVDGLIASLSSLSQQGGGGGREIVIRDSLHTAVLTLLFRMCFGDGVGDDRDVRAVQRVLHDFFDGMVDAFELAGSRAARLLRWRRWRRFLGIRRRMAELLLPLIAERQSLRSSLPRGDSGVVQPYVDSLLDLRVPNYNDGSVRRALTDDEKVTLVWEFLDAGTETVVSCVEWALAHLVNQPEAQEMLRREVVDVGDQRDDRLRRMPYLRAVILESLRLHPPVPVIDREVGAEGAAVVGEAMPVGSTAMRFRIVPGEIGRDGSTWAEPDVFRPERFLVGGEGESVGTMPGPKEFRMLPFGAGTRHCPGEGLGMINARLLLAALVREFEWAPPAKGRGSVDLTEVDGFVKHMKTPLKARITRRKNKPV